MQPFVINRHGRLVFPSNFMPDLDFSVIETEEQLDAGDPPRLRDQGAARHRDRPADRGRDQYTDRVRADARRRAEPVLGQPVRHDDVREGADPLAGRAAQPRRRVPAGRARRGRTRRARSPPSRRPTPTLPPTWDAETEDRIWAGAVRRRSATASFHATELPAIRPTVAEALAEPDQLTFQLAHLRPRLPGLQLPATSSTAARTSPSWRRCTGGRWCCTTSTRGTARRRPADRGRRAARRRRRGRLFNPRSREVLRVHATRSPRAAPRRVDRHPGGVVRTEVVTKQPIRPYPADRRAQAVHGAAEDRGAGRRQG